jgi:hypothetical protein
VRSVRVVCVVGVMYGYGAVGVLCGHGVGVSVARWGSGVMWVIVMLCVMLVWQCVCVDADGCGD